jgi:hypothetical protein
MAAGVSDLLEAQADMQRWRQLQALSGSSSQSDVQPMEGFDPKKSKFVYSKLHCPMCLGTFSDGQLVCSGVNDLLEAQADMKRWRQLQATPGSSSTSHSDANPNMLHN